MKFATNYHLAQLVGLAHAEWWGFGSFVVQFRKVLVFPPFSKFISLVSCLGLGLVLGLRLGFKPSLTDRS